ncbi:MAG TPA: histidinol-phosphate transaminase, partial [Gaiellales bacterium]
MTLDQRALESLVRTPLRGATPYVAGRSPSEVRALYGLDSLLQLGLNEDFRGPLPGVAEASARALDEAGRYPDETYRELRAAIASHCAVPEGLVVLGHGIQALVRVVADSVLEAGDVVVVGQPTYGLYATVAATCGARVVRVPAREHVLDLEEMAEVARRENARIVVVCDPNNPTGARVGDDAWRGLVDAVPDGCLIVADEAYVDYVDPALRIDRVADVEAGRPVVILRTFSKAYGLAGLRLGYALAAPPLATAFDAVQEPFNVNVVALAAGIESLRRSDLLAGRRRETDAARSALTERLAASGIASVPSSASFVLTDVGGVSLLHAEALARQGV